MLFGKKKLKVPMRGKLVCTSEEEYKELLRGKIALQLLCESMTERNGQYYINS